jgi:hypothetical protein
VFHIPATLLALRIIISYIKSVYINIRFFILFVLKRSKNFNWYIPLCDVNIR